MKDRGVPMPVVGFLSQVLLPTQDELQPAVAQHTGEQEPGWHFNPTRRHFLPSHSSSLQVQELRTCQGCSSPGCYKHSMVQQEAKLLNDTETPHRADQSLEQGLPSALLHGTLPEWLEEKFYPNKTGSSTSHWKPATQWDSSCAALLPRYLPGPPHLSDSLCHSMHPSLLWWQGPCCPSRKAHLPIQGRAPRSPGTLHPLHPQCKNRKTKDNT